MSYRQDNFYLQVLVPLFGFNKQKVTLTQEYDYALHAITRLKQHPEVSTDKIFILGHSLGGLMAAHLADSPELSLSTPAKQLPFGLGPGYWLECRSLNPIQSTKDMQKPILILQGGRDYQVTIDNFDNLRSSLQGKANADFRLYTRV